MWKYQWKEVLGVVLGILLSLNIFLYIRQSESKYDHNETTSKQSESPSHSLTFPSTVPAHPATPRPQNPTSFSPLSIVTQQSIYNTTILPTSSKHGRHLPIKHDTPCQLLNTNRDPSNGKWFNFSSSRFVFYAYSAFVDDRVSLQTDAVVRVIAIADVVEDMLPKPSMFCRYRYVVGSNGALVENVSSLTSGSGNQSMPSFDVGIDVEVEKDPVRKIGMGWELNAKLAREYIFTCSIPTIDELKRRGFTNHPSMKMSDLSSVKRLPLPAVLSIFVGHTRRADVTACMPVERPPKPQIKKDIVLCVQVAFGGINPTKLVEWLELQIILGVQSIGIYNLDIHEPAMVVLRHYAEQGLVDLRKTDYIPAGPQQYLLHGSPVINDCMYRNLHSSKYMAVYDIDEVILPKMEKFDRVPFKALLENLAKKYGSGTKHYLFRNAYFFLDLPPDSNEHKESLFLRYKHSVPESNFGYASKSIVELSTCIQMHNHFCWGETKAHENIQKIDVSPSLAKNQHYKKCHFGNEECQKLLEKAFKDDTILVYREELLKRTTERIREISTKLKNSRNPFRGYFERKN